MVAASLQLGALDMRQGRMRMEIHEDSGRVSLYYLEEIKEERYTPLLFDRDPRTSFLGLLLDNRIVTLGSAADFRQSVEKQSDGAIIVWKNARLEIRQRLRFTRSKSQNLADGVRIEIRVRNLSQADTRVGIHYLFDTYLGEQQKVHFTTSAGDSLSRETAYTAEVPAWWRSPAPEHGFDGLKGVMRGGSLTPPDRLVFANWKRLSESTWNLQVQENRKFNLLPYSVNDSAVALFYDQQLLAPGEERQVSLILGVGSDYGGDLRSAETGDEGSGSVEQLTVEENAQPESLRERLIRLNDIIAAIDALIDSEEALTREKVEVLEQSLEELQSASSRESGGR
jgi:hypothetical protein